MPLRVHVYACLDGADYHDVFRVCSVTQSLSDEVTPQGLRYRLL
jgi:hypothetical protein